MSLETKQIIKKSKFNPILTKADIPYPAELIFNAGVTKFNGKYVMVFRNDYGTNEEQYRAGKTALSTNIGIAFSDDGIRWEVSPKPCFELNDKEISRAYDPRLSVIDGRCYMCFAVDTKHGIRGGIAVTDDFEKFDILTMTVPDNRNMVVFPEKINGNFVRLERPFSLYGRNEGNFDIWISESPDCKYWGNHNLLLGTEDVPFSNSKIGPAAPPVKTEKGWLTTFHGVKTVKDEFYAWHSNWNKIYYGGIMLLDLNDPTKIIGMSSEPLLTPEESYEKQGFRGEVIFPGGMILEDSGEIKIYYGAADTVECLATANVNDLLKMCGQ